MQTANQMLFFKPLISIFGKYVNVWVKDERRFPIDVGCPLISNFQLHHAFSRQFENRGIT